MIILWVDNERDKNVVPDMFDQICEAKENLFHSWDRILKIGLWGLFLSSYVFEEATTILFEIF